MHILSPHHFTLLSDELRCYVDLLRVTSDIEELLMRVWLHGTTQLNMSSRLHLQLTNRLTTYTWAVCVDTDLSVFA